MSVSLAKTNKQTNKKAEKKKQKKNGTARPDMKLKWNYITIFPGHIYTQP